MLKKIRAKSYQPCEECGNVEQGILYSIFAESQASAFGLELCESCLRKLNKEITNKLKIK